MSHTVYLEFKCLEGKGAEFLEVLLPSLSDTRAFDGCLSVETYSNSDALSEMYADLIDVLSMLGVLTDSEGTHDDFFRRHRAFRMVSVDRMC